MLEVGTEAPPYSGWNLSGPILYTKPDDERTSHEVSEIFVKLIVEK